MKITIHNRKPQKNFPFVFELEGTPSTVKVSQVSEALANKFPKYSVERQRLTTEDKRVLAGDQTLEEAGLKDNEVIYFKDLGPQIGWRTVFLIEYAGPLFIHSLFYYLPSIFYSGKVTHSPMQTAVYGMVMLHFLKRELETVFVHRFSCGTMPFTNVFKNSAHYWLLSGVNFAYWVYGPWYDLTKVASKRSDMWLYGCIAIWAWAEVSNFITHVTLRQLRPPGTRVRAIPFGYGFDLVSCPNYFFETVGWTSLCFLTISWSVFLFNIVATGQMYVWAIKKHKNYRKEFSDYPRNRKSMFPFIA
ncbi:3-oxo-5-alpha-steroid 4-dehydrogenase-domain-containing protein [Spinellus fusiger]|nr:3-oxo-5-alpha-steroid 4-dehydrogenase-domain-containing protein [Spinellus fusiger]